MLKVKSNKLITKKLENDKRLKTSSVFNIL
jgi:hypothetical protein